MARELGPICRYSCDICGAVFEKISQDKARDMALACEKKGTPRKHAFKIGDDVYFVNPYRVNIWGKIVGLGFSGISHNPFYTVKPKEYRDDISFSAEGVYKIVNGVSV